MDIWPLAPAKILYDNGDELDVVIIGRYGGMIKVVDPKCLPKDVKPVFHLNSNDFHISSEKDKKNMFRWESLDFRIYARTRWGCNKNIKCLIFLEGEIQ